MADRLPTLHVYRGADGDWRWRLVATNGETVASGEGYRNSSDLLATTGRYLAPHEIVHLPDRDK